MKLTTSQQNTVGSIMVHINDIVAGMKLSKEDASNNLKYIHIIINMGSANAEEITVATAISSNSEPGIDAELIQEMKRSDNKPGPTIKIFATNIAQNQN